MEKKVYSFLYQAFIFAVIILIARFISFELMKYLGFAMPASVVGMVLLFTALCLKIVKLEQVEDLSGKLSAIIAFLFVPSGISLINSLDIMRESGVKILFILFIAIIALLGVTGWSGSLLLNAKNKSKKTKAAILTKGGQSNE